MNKNLTKKVQSPISPEYGNVVVLKLIIVCAAAICILLIAYTGWILYSTTRQIVDYAAYATIGTSPTARVEPISYERLQKAFDADSAKHELQISGATWDVFYGHAITSTAPLSVTSSTLTTSTTGNNETNTSSSRL